MKLKKSFIIFTAALLFNISYAYGVNIYTWANLKTQYQADVSETLTIMNKLTANENLGYVGKWSNLTLQGNGQTLDGNNQYSAFNIAGPKTLNIKNISFVNFKKDTDGAAIFSDSNIFYINFYENVYFTSNSATNGGAIYTNVSNIKFNGNSLVRFFDNVALSSGGAVNFANGTNVNADNSRILFTSNTAQIGGALYIEGISTSTIKFSNSYIEFSSNTALINGGAFYAGDNSQTEFNNSTVYFTSNTAKNGGAFFASTYSITIFLNSNVNFINNSAQENGGAFFADGNSTVTWASNVRFAGNSAKGKGGAIYIGENLINTFNVSQNILFENNTAYNNTANPVANDIFIDSNSQLILNIAGNASIDINSGIMGMQNSTITKQGTGSLKLKGNFAFDGTLLIKQGEILISKQSQPLNIGMMKIEMAGLFNYTSTEKIFTSTIVVEGTFETMVNKKDFVLESSGTLQFLRGSSLILKGYGTGSGSIRVFRASDISIDADTINLIGEGTIKRYEIIPSPFGNKELWIYYEMGIKEISGLTPNQSAVFNLLNENTQDDNAPLLSLMLPVQNEVKNGNTQDAKKMLDELSGSFLLTSFKAALMDNNASVFYSRINEIKDESELSSRNVWAQLYFDGYSLTDSDNEMGAFKYQGVGFISGFTIQKLSNFLGGLFSQYSHKNLNQDSASGAINSIDFGVYSSYDMPIKKEIINLKGVLSLGFNNFSLKRKAYAGYIDENENVYITQKTAEADFWATALKYILSADYSFEDIGKHKLIITPFINFQGGFLFNQAVHEKKERK
ncbi:MAG: hypothetical protein LBQ37_04745 [Elusimicrobiota bacterium]|jgi:predicted outer membrane repeat protein|nr:hypothetical protein [Elusimicrobiota bacterium]